LNTRPSITQPPVALYAGCLIQTTNKTNIQTQSSKDRIATSLSPAHQREKKKKKKQKQANKQAKNLSTNLIVYEAHTKHFTNLRVENKRKKEFNLEAWEKETSNTISLKKIIMKRQINTAHKKRNKLERNIYRENSNRFKRFEN